MVEGLGVFTLAKLEFGKKKMGCEYPRKSWVFFLIESPTKIFKELPGTVSLFLYCSSELSPSEGEEKG